MDNFSDDQINKKIDIGLKKEKLEKKYGSYFGQVGNLPPELESEWLSNIEQFEEQYNSNAKKVSVWEYVGKPAYSKADEIEDEKITKELQKLVDYLSEHGIALNTLCEVDDSELYRFITEELFSHELDDIHIDGMMNCFTYEEFHPNAEYDINQAFEYFFTCSMAKMKNVGGDGYDFLYVDTENYKDAKGNKLDKLLVNNKLNTFLDTFDYFEIISNDIKSISINSDKTDCKLTFVTNYKGCFNNSTEPVIYGGNGFFRLKPSAYVGWDIYTINMPGIQI